MYLEQFQHSYRWYIWPTVTLLAILGIFASILSLLQNPVAIDESLRHIAMAKIMAKEGILSQSGWGNFFYHGYFTQRNSDPWFLYHVLLVPFANLPTALVQKIVILSSTAFLGSIFMYICRWLRLSPLATSVLLGILLLGNMQNTLRIFLARPAILLVAISLLCYAFMAQKHWELLFVTLVFATLLSHLFVFPLLIIGVGVLWRWSEQKNEEGFLLVTIAGLAVSLGLWLHPQSANYWQYLLTIFTKLPFLLQLDVGTEMMSGFGREASLLALVGVITFALLAGAERYNYSLQKYHKSGLSILFTIVAVQLIGFFIWVRMIDFLWPLAVVLLASLFSMEPKIFQKTLPEILPEKLRNTHLYLLVFCILLGTNTGKLFHAHWSQDQSKSLQTIAVALQDVPAGSNVLNFDWDLFPMLMSVRPDLHYARGMDPGFNYLVDKRTGPLIATKDTLQHPNIWLQQTLQVFAGTDALIIRSDKHPQLLEFFRSTNSLRSSYSQSKISTFLLK